MTLAYDGGDFHGWQYQPSLPTVQGLVTQACERVLGTPTRVVGASRTDAGVHALGQVASLTTASSIETEQLGRALNALLPPAIRILEAREAPEGFDARRSALGKRYGYLIDRRAVADPFWRPYAHHVPHDLDARAMSEALRSVRGTHDFTSLCAAAGRDRNPTCTVRSARIVTGRGRLAIFVSADSFLHHMVRNLVGSLLEIGRGARAPQWLADVLAAKNRSLAGPTAPARGLALVRVLYPRSH